MQGAGLLVTLAPTTSSSRWIGYQVLLGIGLGLVCIVLCQPHFPTASPSTDRHLHLQGVQIPMIALQAALPQAQVPEGIALMVFVQILGAAVFIQVGQNIFTNRLVQNVRATGIPIDVQQLLQQGLNQVANLVRPEDRDRIIAAYNQSITQVRTAQPHSSLEGC